LKIVTIPNTSLSVAPICMGCANLGVKNTEDEALGLLDAYSAQGGNFIDTARVYSNWVPGEMNRSERIIGDWMADRKNRDDVILATKGGHPVLGTTGSRLSPERISDDLLGSLETLRVEHVDLYWLHRDDPACPVGSILEALHAHQEAGRISHYGCSNWRPERILAAHVYATEHGLTGFVANQMRWSLAGMNTPGPKDTTMCAMDVATHNLHRDLGLAAVPYGSQAGGFFTKWDSNPDSVTNSQFATEANLTLEPFLQATASDLGTTVSAVVVAWLLAQPYVTIPIVGCRTVDQLEDSLSANLLNLPEDVIDRLNKAAGLTATNEP
jgi:aryl-alcohol dehydrogenase-like predicted oxidoreductase